MTDTAVLTDEHPFPTGYEAHTSTPWGPADFAYKYARGIINYSCPGHGGFHLSVARNAFVHGAWRNADGWYEEDCEWAIVALTFPEFFALCHVKAAHQIAKDYFPDAYATVFGPFPIEESHVLRERAFYTEHAEDYVVNGAWGSWATWVPEGYVGVVAAKGRYYRHGAPTDQEWFLVPEAEYEARKGSFVVDPERHPVAETHG